MQSPHDLAQLPERLRVKIAVDPTSPCWVWTAAPDRDGYARVNWTLDGKRDNWKAARVIYIESGRAIPPAHELHHRCRNRKCVNPSHLEPLTHAEHMHRDAAARAQAERAAMGQPPLWEGESDAA